MCRREIDYQRKGGKKEPKGDVEMIIPVIVNVNLYSEHDMILSRDKQPLATGSKE